MARQSKNGHHAGLVNGHSVFDMILRRAATADDTSEVEQRIIAYVKRTFNLDAHRLQALQ
jgi:hypothetical protein